MYRYYLSLYRYKYIYIRPTVSLTLTTFSLFSGWGQPDPPLKGDGRKGRNRLGIYRYR